MCAEDWTSAKQEAARDVLERPSRLFSGDSGLFLKDCAAVAAGDGDFALAPGHPQHLGAGGALEVEMILVLGLTAPTLEPVDHRPGHLQKGVVLRPAAAVVPAHDPEEQNERQKGGYAAEDRVSRLVADDHFRDPEQPENHKQENVQLIVAIAAVHQPTEKITDHKKCSIHNEIIIVYLSTKILLRQ